MASSNIKVSITADDKATGTLKNLDDQVGKTEGGMGKLAKGAAVGGAAIVALGVKSVMAFEDLGLTIGKFADATGTTTEQASRLLEVSDDLGISSETMQSSIGKMSKQLGANEKAFSAYGIEVQKNADGTTNMNETFLASVDAINAIKDPLKKSTAAAEVFGKGYQQMSELLGESSDKIRGDLAAVSDAKVFDDKKVQDARDMRDAFDSIVDAGQDLILTIGKSLAPVIVKLAPLLVEVVEAAAPVAEALGEVLVSALESLGPMIEALLPVVQKLATALTLVADAIGHLKPAGATDAIKALGAALDEESKRAEAAGLSHEQFKEIVTDSAESIAKTGDAQKDLATLTDNVTQRMDELTTSTHETDRETRRLGDAQEQLAPEVKKTAIKVDALTVALADADVAYQRLTGHLDEADAWENVNAKIAEFNTKTDESGAAIVRTAQDTRDLSRDIADYVAHTDTIPAEKKTQIYALLDQGDIDAAEKKLADLTRNRDIRIGLIGAGASTAAGYNASKLPQFAEGGTVPGREGEPVLAIVHGGEQIISNADQDDPRRDWIATHMQGNNAELIAAANSLNSSSPGMARAGGFSGSPTGGWIEATATGGEGTVQIDPRTLPSSSTQVVNVYVSGSVLSERDLIAVVKRYIKSGGQL